MQLQINHQAVRATNRYLRKLKQSVDYPVYDMDGSYYHSDQDDYAKALHIVGSGFNIDPVELDVMMQSADVENEHRFWEYMESAA